jgi:F0F1-type ATP synthase membrane subunit b/b'
MNFKYLLFSLLLTLVILSKEILVFNEEILVLFAFGIFIFLVYNFASGLISLELDARGIKIEEEFSFYRNMQQKTLTHLISYHKKQILLSEEVKSIFLITKKDIDIIISNYSQLFLKFLTSGIDDKLKKIASIELKFNSLLQEKISSELYSFLTFKYAKNSDKKASAMLLTNSIYFLSKVK